MGSNTDATASLSATAREAFLEHDQIDAVAALAHRLGVKQDDLVLIDCTAPSGPRIAAADDPTYRRVAARRQYYRAREPKVVAIIAQRGRRPRARRPGAIRRASSSSTTSGLDPGDPDGDSEPPRPGAGARRLLRALATGLSADALPHAAELAYFLDDTAPTDEDREVLA